MNNIKSNQEKEKILVSACLVGKNCKYNGKNNYNENIVEFLKDYEPIYVCPEQLGGLSTPRSPAEIIGKKVINKDQVDITKEYEKGAQLTLMLAKKYKIKKAILKTKSPSCGKGKIYDGSFSNKLIIGNGITTELLIKNNIQVISSEEIQNLINKLD